MAIHIGRRYCITLLGGAAAAWPLAARAQQSPDRPIVGVLAPQSQAASARYIEAFRKGLRDLGYVEGRNITLEIRYGDGVPERLPQLAAELVALQPAVIRAGSTAGLVAAHNATQTIPLVGATLEDPIALGLVKSIRRPDTNVTGTWVAGDDALVGKRLGLLKDVVPGVSRVAAIVNPGDSSDAPLLRLLPATAHALDLKLLVIEVREASEFPVAFANVARDGQALFISSPHCSLLIAERLSRWQRDCTCPPFTAGGSFRRRAVWSPTGRVCRTYTGSLPQWLTRFSRVQTRPTCRSRFQPDSNWWSI
jgi:putative ABC transport system substrate-binding protein